MGDCAKRRILLVAWFLTPQRLWLAENLDPARYECDYIGLPQRIDITRKRTGLVQWMKHFVLALKARWHLLWRRYDLVVSAFPQVGSMLGLVNRVTFERTPHVVWYFNCGHEYQGMRRLVSRFAFRHVKRFIVYTHRERDVYAKMLSLPRERFHFTFLTGVPLSAADYGGGRARYGLADHYLAALGSSSRDYGTLFKAAEGLGLQTVVVTHRYALAGLDIPPWVKVIESIPQEDYLAILAEADVCVIPVSNTQTASGQMTLIQAMTLGVPVVATRCIGTEDYIRQGETGYLVEMGDAIDLREALCALVDAPEKRRDVAEKAYRFAQEHFLDGTGSRVLDALFNELEASGEL